MRFLADENVPLSTVRTLRDLGYDVEYILEQRPGGPDESVLAVARARQRILLTFDSDFGRLLFHEEAPAPPGLVYLWLHPVVPDDATRVILDLITSRGETLLGAYTTVKRDRIRQRSLPGI